MIQMDTNKPKNLATALLKFHAEVGKVSKNSTNPYFKSKYGDLNAYLEVIKEPLANCGLVLVQMPVTNGLRTKLIHAESGESLESECTIPELTNDPQKLGAAITYLRRYMLAAFLGLNAEDNDCQPETGCQVEAIKKYRKMAAELYKQIKAPSEELNKWYSKLDNYSDVQLSAGIVKMQKLIKEQS